MVLVSSGLEAKSTGLGLGLGLAFKQDPVVLVLKGLVIGLDNNTGYHELTQSLREFTRLI